MAHGCTHNLTDRIYIYILSPPHISSFFYQACNIFPVYKLHCTPLTNPLLLNLNCYPLSTFQLSNKNKIKYFHALCKHPIKNKIKRLNGVCFRVGGIRL